MALEMSTSISIPQSPTFVPPLPQPTYGAGGSFTVVFGMTIDASPVRCLEVVLVPSTYPSWNKWIPRCVVHAAPTPDVSAKSLPASLQHLAYHPETLTPGTRFHFEVHMNPDSPSFNRTDLVVRTIEQFQQDGRKGIRVSWTTAGDPWYLKAERTQEFLETADGASCEYRNYETFYGPVAFAVKLFVGGQLQNGLALWMSGLKEAVEEKARLNSNRASLADQSD
jgi:hypothetical protein